MICTVIINQLKQLVKKFFRDNGGKMPDSPATCANQHCAVYKIPRRNIKIMNWDNEIEISADQNGFTVTRMTMAINRSTGSSFSQR